MIARILLAGLLTAVLLSAQGKKGGGGGENTSLSQAGTPSRLDVIENMLKLSRDQKRDVKSAFDEGQKEAAPLRDQIIKSEIEIGEAVAGASGQAGIDKAVSSYAALETQMASVEMKTFAKVYQSLDKEQQSRAAPVFFMMQGVFKNKNWNDVKQ